MLSSNLTTEELLLRLDARLGLGAGKPFIRCDVCRAKKNLTKLTGFKILEKFYCKTIGILKKLIISIKFLVKTIFHSIFNLYSANSSIIGKNNFKIKFNFGKT